MKQIDVLTDAFKTRIEAFKIGCDSLEEGNSWDKNEYGEMDVYYLNELVSVILKLVVTDGSISKKETEYLNENFDFDYSIEDLAELYQNCQEELETSFDERLQEDIKMLASVSPKLNEEFKGLLGLICDIIAESDGVVTTEEDQVVKNIRAAVSDR